MLTWTMRALILVPARRVLFPDLGARVTPLPCGVDAGKLPALPGKPTGQRLSFTCRPKLKAMHPDRNDDQGPHVLILFLVPILQASTNCAYYSLTPTLVPEGEGDPGNRNL